MKDMDKTEENLIEETASEEKKSRLNTSVLKKLVEEDDGKASKDKEDNGSFVEIEENKSEDKKEDKKKAAPRKKTLADKYLKSEVYDSRKKNKKLRKFFNNALVVLAAIVLGYALTTFCFCTVYMSGPSMEKTLSHGDELIMSKLAYLVGNVERYDIVAICSFFEYEYSHSSTNSSYLRCLSKQFHFGLNLFVRTIWTCNPRSDELWITRCRI